MTLPAEIRLQIWKAIVPDEIELEITGWVATLYEAQSFPENPKVSLLSINRQARSEISTLSHPTLSARLSLYDFNAWFERSVKPRRSLFSRIAVFGVDLETLDDTLTEVQSAHLTSKRTKHLENTATQHLKPWFRNVEQLHMLWNPIRKRGMVRIDYEIEFKVSRAWR